MSTNETAIEVATKDELLKFINTIRRILGMDPLEDLIPSRPELGGECLIANPFMKFGADVGCSDQGPDHTDSWYIEFEFIDEEQEEALSQFLHHIGTNRYRLPEKFAVTATEFDLGNAFQEYNLDLIENEGPYD